MELTSQKMRKLAPELDPLRLGTGWTPDELSKPQIIVESTFGDSHPGSGHLDKLVNAACKGAAEAGGHGARYFATDICDGESQGTDGINFSLASREMIANMIEIHANATPFDGGVYISSCDKGMPAILMGLARVIIPSVVVTGGTMHAGPELLTLEQLGMYSAKYERGEIDEAKLNWAKQNACPSCGACSFIGTASTMQIMAEALGLALPGSALLAAAVEEQQLTHITPVCADLLKAAAAHFGLQPDQIMPGNGSDENLFFALRAFCDEQHPLAYADITYGCYGVWCGLLHIPTHIIPLKADFTLDPADYHGLHETIVIANPNAPTGLALPRSAIEGILKANPDNVVIVDEAYVDFGGESCVPLIDRYENLLVVQTFSKSRQLAGARLGLAMGSASLIADLNRVKFSLNPYNINRLTLKAEQAALEDTAYFEKTRAAIMDTRAWTMQQLTDRGFTVLDSRANFVFASTERISGGVLYKELKKNGILVRHFDAPRIENWLRSTIGTPEQMQALMDAVDKILEV